MATLREQLQSVIRGDVKDDKKTLVQYSRDASVVEVMPQVVVFPKDVDDIKSLVKWVNAQKSENPALSLTPRSAGTDMSGGPLGESIIIDVNKYLQGTLNITGNLATVLPGTFYRDFEKETLAKGMFFPSFPASKNICTVGGIVANNSAGEKTLTYGQTKQYVRKLKVVFADGNEYIVEPLSYDALMQKIAQHDFEGAIYAKVWKLISDNYADIMAAKPKTAKNSAGYLLWDVWNQDTKIFDLTKLIVGSQGTLGIITEITFELVPLHPYSTLLTVFLPTLDHIGPLVNKILKYKPTSIESYDEDTIRLAIKYFPDLLHKGKFIDLIKLSWNFIPEFWMGVTGGFPKLMLLVQFDGDDKKMLNTMIKSLQQELHEEKLKTRIVKSDAKAKKYWTIRRESYNLLRAHGAGKKVATFIEDVIVSPEHLPEFLPKLRDILHSYNLTYSIAGHAGNGNFHIFPLMDFRDPLHADHVLELSEKVYSLVTEYGGSITAEHNDGITRAPFLHKMYSPKMLELFADVKRIFDEKNFMNPHKKVGVTVDYFKQHIIRS